MLFRPEQKTSSIPQEILEKHPELFIAKAMNRLRSMIAIN